jgi:iron complex outermembrane receptor protein
MTVPRSRATRPAMTAIASAAALFAMSVTSAWAQDTATSDQGLQTVVVTAQKRAQPLQKVPVAVSTVDERAIENQQISEFSDLTRVSPALTISQNPNNSNISLRGIGTFAYSIGIESAVAVIVDDVPVVQQLQAFSNLSDITRVEVLRGPQGTLFGKNSSAGLINVVTKESADELGGHVQLTLTSDHERRVEAGVSGPINDQLGYRLNVYAGHRDGEYKNLATGANLNGDTSRGLRLRLDFKPTSALSGKFIADYNKRNVKGPVSSMRDVPAGAKQQNLVPLAPALVGINPSPENRLVRMDDAGFASNENGSLSGSVNWKLDRHTLTSVSTYQDWKYNFLQDNDLSSVDFLGAFTSGAFHGGTTQGGPYHSRMFTQELRLASDGEGVFNYLGGLFYSNSRNERGFLRGPIYRVAKWDAEAGNETMAAFAQADYQIAPATRVNVGLRVNRETIDADFTDSTSATPVNFAGKSSDNAVTGKVALQHDLSKTAMVYGSYATGYKGPGFDISTGFDATRARLPILPETSKAYEIGLKSRFLQNRLQLNAAVFQTDYSDFQAQSNRLDPVTNLIQTALTNVGEMRTRGVELEVAAKPNNTLLLEGSVAYVDAMITKFPQANCYPGQTVAEGCVRQGAVSIQDLAGKRLANAPRLKYNVSATYNFPVGETGYSGIANLNYQHQSKVNFDLANNPRTFQEGYGVLNGSIALSDPSQAFKVTLYVNNLLDKSYATSISDQYNFYGSTAHVLTHTLPRNSQRYVGLRVKYSF